MNIEPFQRRLEFRDVTFGGAHSGIVFCSHELRNDCGRKNPNDRHHDHDLDKRESFQPALQTGQSSAEFYSAVPRSFTLRVPRLLERGENSPADGALETLQGGTLRYSRAKLCATVMGWPCR